MSDVKVTIPRGDYNPNQRTDIDVEVVNPDGTVSTKTVKGAVQATTQEDGSVSFGILASAHVPFATGGDYATEVLADSPFAYYRLNDASGNPADSSGNSRTATGVTGGPTYNTSGGPVTGGGYLNFDGVNDYVALGNVASWNEAQATFAVEFWMRTSASGNASIMGTLNNSTSVVYHVKVNRNAADTATDAGDLSTYVRETSDGGAERASTVTSDGDYTDGTWQHIGIDYDFTTPGSEAISVYRNGAVEASTISKSGTIESADLGFFQHALTLGARNLRGSIIEYCAVDLAEVAFYRGNLGATRWAAHYAAA